MNTPAHVLLGVAVCGTPGSKSRNTAALVGSVLPDATIVGMVAWQGWVIGRTGPQIFGIDYFTPFWQEVFAVSNSLPLFFLCAVLGLLFRRSWIVAFAAAAILHVFADLPLHADDGHPPFWPFSEWIFASPYSYWDVRYGGGYLAPAEFVLTVAMAVWMFGRYRDWLPRIAVGICLAVEGLFALGGSLMYGG